MSLNQNHRHETAQRIIALAMALICAFLLPSTPYEGDTTAVSAIADGNISPPPVTVSPSATPPVMEINLFAPPESAASAPLTAPASTPAPTSAVSTVPGFSMEVVHTPTPARKRVLIYHTHTYEAYEPSPNALYKETERWRTADAACNVVRVGEELAGLLRALGVDVTHDTSAFEPPKLSSAYTRSLEMLERRKSAGEVYDLAIDLHRDAYSAGQGANVVRVGGTNIARLMLLIGKGEGQTNEGFDERPDWEANLRIAQEITDALNAQLTGLCKNVHIKSGRYNQHVSVGCILIEVGNNQNTLEEALAAMPYLADAIAGAKLSAKPDE